MRSARGENAVVAVRFTKSTHKTGFKTRSTPATLWAQMTRPQQTSAAKPVACRGAVLERGGHVLKVESEGGCAEDVPGSVAL
jgi:hypothetical protein